MFEKTIDAVFAYCFGVLEVFCAFFEATHAVVGLGVPLVLMIAVHLYLPIWVGAAIASLVLVPAAAAMVVMMIEGLLLTRRN
jgi:hypothetical protein